MNDYTVRQADASDLAMVQELNQASNPHPWKSSLVEDALNTRQNWLLFQSQTGALVGWLTASLLFDQTELELVLTDQAYRRRGLGNYLTELWLKWAQEQACTEAMLEVRESNLGAIELYKKLGFIQVGVRKNYYPLVEGGAENALLMTRSLINTEVDHD